MFYEVRYSLRETLDLLLLLLDDIHDLLDLVPKGRNSLDELGEGLLRERRCHTGGGRGRGFWRRVRRLRRRRSEAEEGRGSSGGGDGSCFTQAVCV